MEVSSQLVFSCKEDEGRDLDFFLNILLYKEEGFRFANETKYLNLKQCIIKIKSF